jgi:hypothetical protein
LEEYKHFPNKVEKNQGDMINNEKKKKKNDLKKQESNIKFKKICTKQKERGKEKKKKSFPAIEEKNHFLQEI